MEYTFVASGAIALGSAAYVFLRPGGSVKANCWFCSENTRVKYANRNSWTCKSCGQYNGFNSEGDYNRDIPEQRVGFPNGPLQYADVRNVNRKSLANHNGLCRNCNLNQELKILQLKNFSPTVQENYESELQDYETLLDKTYGLCRYCEARLHQKLGEQDCWLKPKLLAWKLEQSRQSPLSSANKLKKQQEDALQRGLIFFLSWILFAGTATLPLYEPYISTTIYWKSVSFNEIVSALLVTILIFYGLNPAAVINHRCHQASVVIWILIFVFSTFEELILKWIKLQGYDFFLRSFLSFFCMAASTYTFKLRSNVEKKSEGKSKQFTFSSKIRENYIDEDDETLTQDLLSNSSKSSTEENSKSSSGDKSFLRPPLRPSLFGQMLQNHEIYQGDHSDSLSFSCDFPEGGKEPNAPDCDLSNLFIDKSLLPIGPGGCSPIPFEVKQFDPLNTSGINFGNGKQMNKQTLPVLRQPRFVYQQSPSRSMLQSVAQSSWVAGGYWQMNRGLIPSSNEPFSDRFSRSSSQTSGFISCSAENPFSNFTSLPNSRVNSLYGDRNSVLSEPIFNTQREMNLQTITDQLAFYDTSRKSQRSFGGSDSDSFNSSIGKFSQSILSSFKPNAESSPVEKRASETPDVCQGKSVSILHKEFSFRISVYSAILFLSVSVNIIAVLYLGSKHFL